MQLRSDRFANRSRVRLWAALWMLLPLFAPALATGEAPVPGAAIVQGATEDELADFLGKLPDRCVQVDASARLCAWRGIGNREAAWKPLAAAAGTRYRVTVVCELPLSGAPRSDDDCTVFPAVSNRDHYRLAANAPKKNRKARIRGGPSPEKRVEQARAQARVRVEAAQDMRSLVEVIGDVPDRCVPSGDDSRSCRWRLDSRTWGHGTLCAAHGYDMGRRLRAMCEFASDGKRLEACALEIDK